MAVMGFNHIITSWWQFLTLKHSSLSSIIETILVATWTEREEL